MRGSTADLPARTGRPPVGRRVVCLLAAAVLVSGAGAGAVALTGGVADRSAEAEGHAASRTAMPPTEGLSAPGSVAVTPFEPLLTAPPVSWQLFAGVPLPYSATAGPRLVDGLVHAGFERSQTGALLAAAHLSTRYLLTPGSGWREVVARQVLPGPGRDAYVRLRATVDDSTDSPGGHGQPAGFRVLAFTPDVAVVQEAIRFPESGVLQVTSTTLRWVGGDWRLQLQPDGSTSPTAQQVPDLDGFVVWGP
jgi:hypothetical protein